MKKHVKKVHGHIESFKKTHNVGYTTLALLIALAVETNVLAAYNLYTTVA